MQNNSDIKELNEFQFNNLFNSSLINNLPYLFWMYELIDNEYKLIKWNKNQEIYTEYSAEELYHKNAIDFFDEKGQEKAKIAIAEIFKNGKSNLFENLLTKSGKLIYYYFEGYLFNYSNRNIFIGISVNMSEQIAIKEKLKLAEVEKERLYLIQQKNKKELLSYSSKFLHNNIIYNKISRQVDHLLTYNDINHCKDEIIKLKKIIESQHISNYYWEVFQSKFDKVYGDFIDRLKLKHPDLTISELQFCSFLKVQIPISDITSLLNISKEGIKKKKYRIRKKFNLNKSDSIEFYLSKF